jgi:parallel beta-helix repeat protein
MRFVTAIAVAALLAASAFSATIYVPDDHPAIQAAIDASSNGDTIIVRPGTYVENIDFLGKAVRVKSEFGPTSVIDGNLSGSVVTFQSGEGADSILNGFTIRNGSGTLLPGSSALGGGIYCVDTSPTITNNNISDNTATDGGGIMCYLSSPTISNNRITGNTASRGGGGIDCWPSSDPTVTNNTISNNTAFDGGGIKCWSNCSVTIANTILRDNFASTGREIWIGTSSSPSTISIDYSDVEGGEVAAYVEAACTLNWGAGMIDADPLFVTGPLGDDYLSQTAAGQPSDSPCVDTGDPASLLISGSTRTDEVQDSAATDMGYHYPPYIPVPVIKIDGQDGPLTIPSTQSILMTIHLDPGADKGVIFDWWILAQKKWGITFSWHFPGNWKPGQNAFAHPLKTIQSYTFHNGTIPVGTWTLAFAVDALNNTYEGTYVDMIEVTSY